MWDRDIKEIDVYEQRADKTSGDLKEPWLIEQWTLEHGFDGGEKAVESSDPTL